MLMIQILVLFKMTIVSIIILLLKSSQIL